MRLACFFLFAFVLRLDVWAQASMPSDSLDQLIRAWWQRAEGSPEFLLSKGEEIRSSSSNCDSLLLAYGLMLRGYRDLTDVVARPEFDTLHCPYRGAEILREEGGIAFDQMDYSTAIHRYKRSLQEQGDERRKASTLQAIGACYHMMGELEKAAEWYSESTEMGLELLSGLSLSNLANIYWTMAKPHEALRWAELSEARLINEFEEGMPVGRFQSQRDLALVTQCIAHLDLGHLDEAENAFSRISFEGIYPGLAPELYHTALLLAWWLNDPYPVEVHADVLSAELLMDSVGAVERFGPTLCLIEPWRSSLIDAGGVTAKGIWDQIRALPPYNLPELPVLGRSSAAQDAKQNIQNIALALSLSFLLGSLIFGISMWKKERQEGQSIDSVLALQRLKRAIYGSAGFDKDQVSLAFIALIQELGPQGDVPLPRDLSKREMDVLQAIVDGERAKDTAQRLDLSPKTVYMARTDVRKKVEEFSGQDFEKWLNRISR